MSLKAFHIVFIFFSILLAFGFAVWSFSQASGNFTMVLIGIFSVAIGIGLIFYAVRFLKKLKHVSYL